ncbi:MAG TPA: zinc-ribbon domain-containing protein [Thermoplasmata archaeon]|nr:zinc-ribbon domain-containing protein [Thermoplasmata archaeon]
MGPSPAAPAAGGATCPKCNQPIATGAKFCPSCGAQLQAPPVPCPKCQTPVPPPSKFCSNCGTGVT